MSLELDLSIRLQKALYQLHLLQQERNEKVYDEEGEKLKILEELLKEQGLHENTDHTAR